MYYTYLKSVQRYKLLIWDIYHRDTIFAWARIWGSVVIFRSQKEPARKKVWETLSQGAQFLRSDEIFDHVFNTWQQSVVSRYWKAVDNLYLQSNNETIF